MAAVLDASAQDNSAVALELPEATELAVTAQPLIDAQRHGVRSAREAAVAAAQLPDPMLSGGITDFTIEGSDRYTLRNESDTQILLGVKQTFPGAGKRALRGARGDAQAERLDAELADQLRLLRREAGLAWLDVWKAVQAQALTRHSIVEAQRQEQAVEIAYRSARATQADLLAARVATERVRDELAGLQQEEWHARNQLRRWIGADAERLMCPDLPDWPAPDAAALLRQLDRHPHVAAQERALQLAQAELALARSEYRPDWSVQVGYGHRPAFADYASLQFEVGLPLFTRNRQARGVAAGLAGVERAASLKEDWLRQHRAAIALNVSDWQRLGERLARYDQLILPQAQRALDAALTAYGAGSASLVLLLQARRSLLEIRMQRLALQVDAARHQVQLQYFAAAVSTETQS